MWINPEAPFADNFIVFLNSTPQGGAVVFPGYSKTIQPVAGSVLFWKGLNSDGNPNVKTIHAICPAIKGHNNILRPWS